VPTTRERGFAAPHAATECGRTAQHDYDRNYDWQRTDCQPTAGGDVQLDAYREAHRGCPFLLSPYSGSVPIQLSHDDADLFSWQSRFGLGDILDDLGLDLDLDLDHSQKRGAVVRGVLYGWITRATTPLLWGDGWNNGGERGPSQRTGGMSTSAPEDLQGS
jgi:hypothetical protein